MVVGEMAACPSNSCTTRRSAPWLSRWVANAWRSVCGDSGTVMPATRAHCLTMIQNMTRVMQQPLLAALAGDAQQVFIERQMEGFQPHQFGHPQAAGIHQFQHRAVAQAQ